MLPLDPGNGCADVVQAMINLLANDSMAECMAHRAGAKTCAARQQVASVSDNVQRRASQSTPLRMLVDKGGL